MIQHGGLISSKGANGWYHTTQADEIIEFEYPINSILVETLDDSLEIQLNGNEDNKTDDNLWRINANDKEGINGVSLKTIMIHGDAGQVLRWKGLIK